MNVDPTGMSAQTSGHVTGETSVGSIVFNVFVAPLISIFTKEYWSDVAHNRDQAARFLELGIVAEVAFFALNSYALSAVWRGLSTATRFTAQSTVDVGLNVGQAAVSATHGGQLSVNEFGQNLEGLPMGMFYARGLVGFGRRSHNLRGADVARRVAARDDTVLIFRSRNGGWSSPVLEHANLGAYHDNLLAVSKSYSTKIDISFAIDDATGVNKGYTNSNMRRLGNINFEEMTKPSTRYEYVGQVEVGASRYAHYVFHKYFKDLNPRNHYIGKTKMANGKETVYLSRPRGVEKVEPFSELSNNCHMHVTAAISELRTGQYGMR